MSPVERLSKRIDAMNKNRQTWISEDEAARMLGYKPRVLRLYAKTGKLDISYTTMFGRKYQYDKGSIEKVLHKNAVII